jgi:serine/threonine-protein kinase HipA
VSARDRFVVRVNGARAGVLAAEPTGRHVFAYDADCPAERFVALTMPVRLESYVWHELHPVFQSALPDEAWPAAADPRLVKSGAARPIDRLAALGAGFGRLSIEPDAAATAPGAAPAAAVLDAHAHYVRSSAAHPERAFVAWCCLRVAKRGGVGVPAFELQDDGATLRIERSDGVPGERLGYEDFCALLGLGAAQRYEATCERLVSAAASFVAPVRRTGVRREVFRRIALAWLLRDGDAHLRTLALLYSGIDDVRLAPVHCLATTAVAPGRADDGPALQLAGRRSWKLPKGAWRKFGAHCSLTDRESLGIFQWFGQAVQAEIAELERDCAAGPRGELVRALHAQWRTGLEDLLAAH